MAVWPIEEVLKGENAGTVAADHDATANFFRRQELWERMSSSDVPKQIMRTSSGDDMEFPLRVISTTPVDSHENRSVQLCDVLAGLTTRVFDRRIQGADRDFLIEVLQAGFCESLCNGVRFEPVFPDQIPVPTVYSPAGYSGGDPDILVMQAADMLELFHDPLSWQLDQPACGRVLC